jgi:hypothetical protein
MFELTSTSILTRLTARHNFLGFSSQVIKSVMCNELSSISKPVTFTCVAFTFNGPIASRA